MSMVEVPDWRQWKSSLTDLGQDEVPQPADTVHVVPVDVPGGEVWEMDLLGDKWPGEEEEVRRRGREERRRRAGARANPHLLVLEGLYW